MAHRLSLAFLTVFDAAPPQAVHIAAACGYHAVGLRMLPSGPGQDPLPLMSDNAVLRQTRSALRDTGVQMADLEIARLGAGIDIAGFRPFLERGAELGARHVLVAGDDPDLAGQIDSFARFCELARDHGMTADLEPMPWTAVPDLARARQVVEGAGAPNGAILIDALHFDRAGDQPDALRQVPRGLLNYAQICDGPDPWDPSVDALIRVARDARLLPGEGGIDLTGIIRALPDDLIISVEVPQRALAQSLTPMERAERARNATVDFLTRLGRRIADANRTAPIRP